MTQVPKRPDAVMPPSRSTLRHLVRCGLLLVTVVVVSLALVGALHSASSRWDVGQRTIRPSAAGTTDHARRIDPAAQIAVEARELFERRASAWTAHDRRQWSDLLHDQKSAFGVRQLQSFDNSQFVPFSSLKYDLTGMPTLLSPERSSELGVVEAWVVPQLFRYSLRGSDGHEIEGSVVRRQVTYTVVRGSNGLKIIDDIDGRTSPELWDFGTVHVVHGKRSVVLGLDSRETLHSYAYQTDRAAARVDKTLGNSWPRIVTIVAPTQQSQVAAMLDRENENGLNQLAAITTGEIALSESAPIAADRIILNPNGFRDLVTLGQDIVLAHEITHVATRALFRGDLPIWLSEGFADYVAYKDRGVSKKTILRELASDEYRKAPFKQLPETKDFNPQLGNVVTAYATSWLAVTMIKEKHGERKLLEFIEQMVSPPKPRNIDSQVGHSDQRAAPVPQSVRADQAFKQVLGESKESFVTRWRAESIRWSS